MHETQGVNCNDMRYRNGIEYEVWTVSIERCMKSMKCELYALYMCGSVSISGNSVFTH